MVEGQPASGGAVGRDLPGRPRPLFGLLAVAWYGLVFALSQAPGADAGGSFRLLDLVGLGSLNGLARMLAHMALFGAQAVLVFLALGGRPAAPTRRSLAGAAGITLLLAIGDELHQYLVPLRHGRAVDVAFDMLGAVLALGLIQAIARRRAGGRSGWPALSRPAPPGAPPRP